MKTKLHLLFLLLFISTAVATPTTPTSDFIDNNNGTVTHKTTGLTWMRCALGETWTGSTCTGTANTYTYYETMALTSSFAGFSDWRLPNIAELQTIVERENINPSINTTAFPNTRSNAFWSSSSSVSDPHYVRYVDFSNGYVYRSSIFNELGKFNSLSLSVRLVRVSQLLGIGLSTSDFIDNNNGTVTHKTTGLTWMRCALGETWTGSTCTGTAKTYTYYEIFSLKSNFAGKSDWRVPDADELTSIISYDERFPVINTAIFPNISYHQFWSSSSFAGFPSTDGRALSISMLMDGSVAATVHNRKFPVILLRSLRDRKSSSLQKR